MNLPTCYQCKQPPTVHDGGTYITCRTCGIGLVARDAARQWCEMQEALRKEAQLQQTLKPCRKCKQQPSVMIGGNGLYMFVCECMTVITDAPSDWDAKQEGTR